MRVDHQVYNVQFRESSAVKYGKFQCATRAGVQPLWLIDGVSATSIKTELGFENVTYSIHPLIENGSFTLLYVPGYVETNNSRIRCAAFVDGEIVEFSNIAYFTVYCELDIISYNECQLRHCLEAFVALISCENLCFYCISKMVMFQRYIDCLNFTFFTLYRPCHKLLRDSRHSHYGINKHLSHNQYVQINIRNNYL